MQTGQARERIRILIVDDQALFATSLKLVLENSGAEGLEVVGIAANGRECIEMVGALEPDIVLMDVYMPEMDGVEAAAAVHRDHPRVKIMMLTTFDDDAYVKSALKAGASGYVLKTIDAEDLVSCVRSVSKGILLMSPSVGARFFGGGEEVPGEDGPAARAKALQARFPELKPRETEILSLVLQGNSNHQIAGLLFIAEQTVRNYTSSIYAKIGVDDRLQAIQLYGSLR